MKIQNLTPVTPNYPQVDHWPLNLDLEGLKLMYMHESYTSGQAM